MATGSSKQVANTYPKLSEKTQFFYIKTQPTVYKILPVTRRDAAQLTRVLESSSSDTEEDYGGHRGAYQVEFGNFSLRSNIAKPDRFFFGRAEAEVKKRTDLAKKLNLLLQ